MNEVVQKLTKQQVGSSNVKDTINSIGGEHIMNTLKDSIKLDIIKEVKMDTKLTMYD